MTTMACLSIQPGVTISRVHEQPQCGSFHLMPSYTRVKKNV